MMSMMSPSWNIQANDYVRKLCWSPNGQRLALGLADGTLRLLESMTGSESRVIQAHKGGVLSMAWSPDGHYLATGGEDGFACLWHMNRSEPPEKLDSGFYWVEHIAWCPRSRRLATAAGRNLRIWNLKGELQH
jgi:WD40 repeat protein